MIVYLTGAVFRGLCTMCWLAAPSSGPALHSSTVVKELQKSTVRIFLIRQYWNCWFKSSNTVEVATTTQNSKNTLQDSPDLLTVPAEV